MFDNEGDVFGWRAGEISVSVAGAVGEDRVRGDEDFDVEAGGE